VLWRCQPAASRSPAASSPAPRSRFEQSTTPTPTIDGRLQWDSDNNRLAVGDGAGTKVFSDNTVVEDRANHSGTQTAATISDFNTAVRTSRLDQMANPTASVDLNGQKIIDLADPATDQEAATKAYVDANSGGAQGPSGPAGAVLYWSSTDVVVSGTTSETTLATTPIGTLTPGSIIRYRAAGTMNNNTTVTQTPVFTFKFGGTTIFTRSISHDCSAPSTSCGSTVTSSPADPSSSGAASSTSSASRSR
jgi:hypothetical protein